MLTIGELVTVDQQAEFRNDVQLDAFDRPEQNLGLLRSYLFSTATPFGKTAGLRSTSSVDLLNEVIEAFLNARIENRLVAIANYGHGKSHLALAMANYFSRPFASEEAQVVLGKLAQAVNDPARAARFRDFKESRGEFLVVRLRGDIPRSLKEQFLMGLERALNEHERTRGAEMPFWYPVAERVLKELTPDEKAAANAFLSERHTDVPQLIEQLQKRRDVYDLCVELITHLHRGVPPNLGGAVSMRDTIKWAVQKYCTGPDAPLGGVLVLFDEFSLYIQRFAQRAAGDMMDLLNGIDDHQGKAVFLAFGQHDPLTVADNVPMQHTAKESLKHELERLPQKQKHVLYSLLESVIDAYLAQNQDQWKLIRQNPKISTSLMVAGSLAEEHFAERYGQRLRWSDDQFQKTVTEGCFPLHPMTTAFLCNVGLQAASNIGTPRTVLGFVFEQLKERSEQQVLVDGRLNWVLPVELVDYFQSRLAEDDQFRAYRAAQDTLAATAPETFCALLKALLLQSVARIKVSGDQQVKLLAQLAGLSADEARSTLTAMGAARNVRYDPLSKTYSFRSADGVGAEELAKIIDRQLENLPFDGRACSDLGVQLASLAPSSGFGNVPLDLPWGDRTDWAAKELILTRELCDAQHLKAVLPPQRFVSGALQEEARGAVVWLLARQEEDVAWFQTEINGILDAAFPGDAVPPILCLVPTEPLPELIAAYQHKRALLTLRDEDRRKIGMESLTEERERAEQNMLDSLTRLRGHETRAVELGRPISSYAAPLAYRARVAALASPSVHTVLDELYRLAYRYSPPEFLTQFRLGAPKLRSATKIVGRQLLRGTVASLRQGSGVDPVASSICNKVLFPKWRLIAADYRTQVPDDRHIRQAWDYLDGTIAPGKGEVRVDSVFTALLNAPYGYDANTVTLIFAAWFGWRAHDLTVSIQGHAASQDNVGQWLERGTKEFLAFCSLNAVALTRAEPGTAKKRLRDLLEKARTGTFAMNQAQALLIELRDLADDDTHDDADRSAARKAADALNEAWGFASQYEGEAKEIVDTIQTQRNLEKLISVRKRIEQLPHLTNVTTDAPQPAALHEQLTTRLTSSVDDLCRDYSSLRALTDLALNRDHLDKLASLLRRNDLTELLQKVNAAQAALEARAKALKGQEQEAALVERIRGTDTNVRLKALYDQRKQLIAMTHLVGSTAEVRDAKLAEINSRIAKFEKEADELLAGLALVDGQAALTAWRDRTLRSQNLLDDTEYRTSLDQAFARAEQMRSYFNDVNSLQNAPLSTPADVERIERELTQLETRYAAVLGEPQKATIAKARLVVQMRVQNLQSKALAELIDLENKAKGGTPLAQLRARLANPPAFLQNDYHKRWQDLQAEVEDRVERQKREQALQDQIRGMDAGARLVVLYGYQKQLVSLGELSSATRQLRDQQLEQVTRRIARLEQQAADLVRGLAGISSARELSEWRARALKAQAQYDETEYETILNNVLRQAERLGTFFESLARVQAVELRGPEDVLIAEQQLEGIRKQSADVLSESQAALVEQANRDLQSRAVQHRSEAQKRLSELERQVSAGTSSAKLRLEARDVPAFLPVEELTRWQALQAHVELLLNQEAADRLVREQIEAMDAGARLVVLQGYREKLAQLQPVLPATVELRNKRRAAIDNRIKQLEQDVERLTGELDQVDNAQGLDAWRGRVHKVLSAYEETPYQTQLEQALGRSERLRSFIQGAESLAKGRRSTPLDVQLAEGQLEELEQRHDADLSQRQRSLVANVRTGLRDHVEREQKAAHAQLADLLTRERGGASLADLKVRAVSVPSFLTGDDLREWEALQTRVRERLDNDIVAQIEDKFRQITSVSQREECLARLRKTLVESAPRNGEASLEEVGHG